MTTPPQRRPRGSGSVFYDASRRKWVGVANLGPDPQTGKRIRRKVYADDAATCSARLDDLRRGISAAESWVCHVPGCRHRSATQPPVLLCSDHRDLLLMQLTTRRGKGIHDPVVYFARNGSRYKIGWTTNLRARMRTLALPVSAVAATVPGGPELEAQLHEKFWRSHAEGEWFDATPDLNEHVQRLASTAMEGT